MAKLILFWLVICVFQFWKKKHFWVARTAVHWLEHNNRHGVWVAVNLHRHPTWDHRVGNKNRHRTLFLGEAHKSPTCGLWVTTWHVNPDMAPANHRFCCSNDSKSGVLCKNSCGTYTFFSACQVHFFCSFIFHYKISCGFRFDHRNLLDLTLFSKDRLAGECRP